MWFKIQIACLILAVTMFTVFYDAYVKVSSTLPCDELCISSLPTSENSVAIVLGMGPTKTSPISDRMQLAVQLYQQGKVGVFLVSGGQGRDEAETEAVTMQKMLVLRGVPKDRIYLEQESTNTVQNLQNSLKILEDEHIRPESLYVVTHTYHAHRVASISSKLGLHSQVLSAYGAHLDHLLRREFRESLSLVWWWIKTIIS